MHALLEEIRAAARALDFPLVPGTELDQLAAATNVLREIVADLSAAYDADWIRDVAGNITGFGEASRDEIVVA